MPFFIGLMVVIVIHFTIIVLVERVYWFKIISWIKTVSMKKYFISFQRNHVCCKNNRTNHENDMAGNQHRTKTNESNGSSVFYIFPYEIYHFCLIFTYRIKIHDIWDCRCKFIQWTVFVNNDVWLDCKRFSKSCLDS